MIFTGGWAEPSPRSTSLLDPPMYLRKTFRSLFESGFCHICEQTQTNELCVQRFIGQKQQYDIAKIRDSALVASFFAMVNFNCSVHVDLDIELFALLVFISFLSFDNFF